MRVRWARAVSKKRAKTKEGTYGPKKRKKGGANAYESRFWRGGEAGGGQTVVSRGGFVFHVAAAGGVAKRVCAWEAKKGSRA